jgi:hypothetical protein
MSERVYTSSVDRLATLPDVFTGGDLTVLFGWKSAICSNYLAVWRKAKLIKSLGGRSDVHMNLLRNRQINPEAALRRALPRAIKVGVDILREAGWTTQIPNQIDVAVPPMSPLYNLVDFVITTRTEKWFQCVVPGTESVPQGIDRLHPAWALADMIARAEDRRVRHAWLLDPEDIDLQAVRHDKSITSALRAFRLNADCVDDDGYQRLYRTFKKLGGR